MESMFVLTTALLRRALRMALTTGGEQLEEASTWPDVLLPKHKGGYPARQLARTFESMLDAVAEELRVRRLSDFVDVPEPVADAVQLDLAELLDAEPFSLTSEHFSKRTGTISELAHTIVSGASAKWADPWYGKDGRAYGQVLAEFSCYALDRWLLKMPQYTHGGAWLTLARASTLFEITRKMLSEMVRADLGGRGHLRVLGTQRRDLTASLGRMELFGLPVEERFRWVPIEVSYLSASIGDEQHGSRRHYPLEELIRELLSSRASGPGMRLLISGRAGSGKTTAAQWIAYNASQQRLSTGRGATIIQYMPLFVRLREVITSPTPPSDRMLLYSDQLRDEVTASWLGEIREIATPLIVLDGWDEVLPRNKAGARLWVERLIERFPEAHLVMTTRPEGIEPGDFDKLQLRRVTMLAVRPEAAVSLVDKWFAGLAANLQSIPDVDRSRVELARKQLKRDLDNPEIQRMVDTPLLTAMMCCLYSSRREMPKPEMSVQLYDLVGSALIERRDREREAKRGIWDELTLKQKKKLIGSVACAMAERGVLAVVFDGKQDGEQFQVDPDVIETLISMGRLPSEAPALLREMLDRSVVLQRVSSSEIEFLHRSFQDYFAASSYIEFGRVDDLLDRAGNGQLSMLPFACYEATTPLANSIIRWLLDRIEETHAGARRLMLFTLAECVATASSFLSEENRQRADRYLGEIFPPTDEDEARSLAGLGNAAVKHLERAQVSERYRRYAIDTLSRIGSHQAIEALHYYAAAATGTDAQYLSEIWGRLDAEGYRDKVLAHLPHPVRITLHDETRMRAAFGLHSISHLHLRQVDVRRDELRKLGADSLIPSLRLDECRNVGSLAWTTSFSSLRQLSVVRCSDLSGIGAVGPTGLWGLELRDLKPGKIDWLEMLGRLPRLRVVWIELMTPSSFTIDEIALSRLRDLSTLVVGSKVTCESLAFLGHNKRLRRLSLHSPLSEADIDQVAGCHSLRDLSVRFASAPRDTTGIGKVSTLERLTLAGASAEMIGSLVSLPRLAALTVLSSDLGDFAELVVPRTVRTLLLRNCTRRDEYWDKGSLETPRPQRPAGPTAVEELVLDRCSLADLLFLKRFPYLRTLKVFDDGTLPTLDGLEHVPDGCVVQIEGTRSAVDDASIRRLERRGSCNVSYIPEFGDDAQVVS